jgi:hypothetical protein
MSRASVAFCESKASRATPVNNEGAAEGTTVVGINEGLDVVGARVSEAAVGAAVSKVGETVS